MINEMTLNSRDYRSWDSVKARADYHQRIHHYASTYESLDAALEPCSFIQIIDAGKQLFCNQVYGYLQSRMMFFLANVRLAPRPIWFTRHGQSVANVEGRIGGDSDLSPLGQWFLIV